MRKSFGIIVISLVIVAFSAYAHHPAANIVDEEIYAMIDEMVSDTPHADMVFDDMGGGDVTTTISTRVRFLEELVDDGLLSTAAELNGEIFITIELSDNRDAVMTIVQTPE